MTYRKDPSASLDYLFQWGDYLAGGETISSYAITADDGITIDSDSIDGSDITVWVSGGLAGFVYTVTCEIVTDLGVSPAKSRTDQRSVRIVVADQ